MVGLFNSNYSVDPRIKTDFEDDSQSLIGGGVYKFLIIMSALLLLITFPITAFFCIKVLYYSSLYFAYFKLLIRNYQVQND